MVVLSLSEKAVLSTGKLSFSKGVVFNKGLKAANNVPFAWYLQEDLETGAQNERRSISWLHGFKRGSLQHRGV